MKNNDRQFQFIIFGATGYTGKYCIELMVKCLEKEETVYRWAIAGRNEAKLIEARNEVANVLGSKLDHIPIIIADSGDDQSLINMCEQCNVLINCAGPYSKLGEPVVKACLQTITHQLDLSGEFHYNDYLRLKYHSEAEEKGVLIVNWCGIGVLFETGVNYMKDSCKSDVLNSIDYYVHGMQSSVANHGTYDSFTELVSHMTEIIKNRMALNREVFTKPMPRFEYHQKSRYLPFYSIEEKGWCFTLNAVLGHPVIRAQHYNYIHDNERPTQVNGYVVFSHFLHLIALLLMIMVMFIFARFDFGVRLLLKYPKIFSFGFSSPEGPTREEVMQSKFKITFLGKGWRNVDDTHRNPNVERELILKGPNLPYVTTSICVISSAITIQEEFLKQQISFRGGVFTSGIAFRRTRIADRLIRNSISFNLSEK